MKYAKCAAFGLALGAAGAAVSAPGRQAVTGPIAEYWMSASTTSGMGAMMGGGGGRPNMAQMMSGGFNPNQASHSLILQLGTSRHAEGDPAAEHDPPQDLGAGPMLPLVSPEPAAPPTHQEAEPGPPPQYQQPHGRMLIFWGCGEHTGPNQPYVIDFANMANGQGAQQFMGLMKGLAISPMQPPSPQRNATYGEWPNRQSDTSVPPSGSLVGPHLIKGNYTPDINFSLTPAQDFLPGFALTTNQKNPSGSAGLGWQPMPGAQGFFATMFGAQGQDQIVMWTSSAVQASAFGLPQYLSNAEISRLVGQHVLMPSSQTDCTIPAEAVQAAGHSGFFTLTAYGGEANFTYPARPPAPQPWHIQWQVKVRYRSSTGGLVGVDMGRMGQSQQSQRQQQRPQQKRPGLGSFIPGLGGFIP